MKRVFFLALIGLSSCAMQGYDDELRTVPITNNPTIVPTYGIAGVGG